MPTTLLPKLVRSAEFNMFCAILLAIIWGIFAYTHVVAFQMVGEPALLLFVVAETLTAGFYLLRTKPESVSIIPLDWLMAFAGTFVPLLFRPTSGGLMPWASNLMIAGVVVQILAIASLNRSFALVAAKRNIKTQWMYGFVRHPVYASYFLTFTGYLLVHTSLSNVAIYASTLTLLIVRIFREEKHLSKDPAYTEYMCRVQYRLLPFIF